MKPKTFIYKNKNNWCECWVCELNNTCQYKDKFQRLPREQGGLGLCKKLAKEDKH